MISARMGELFSAEEADGLRLFIGDGQCTNCHNGPLFTNGTFHNIGLPFPEGSKFDQGRSQGTLQVVEDEFNCLGEYSDANEKECVELRFIKLEGEELVGAFKVPSLRNVANTNPVHAQRHLPRPRRGDSPLQSRAAGLPRPYGPGAAGADRGAKRRA